MQTAIIKKDITGITANRRMIITLVVVPLVMTIFVPLSFILPILLSPEDSRDMAQLLELVNAADGNHKHLLINYIVNNIMPLFFIMIPIMASSVMAASSFIGEKEKRTLETLLYSPLKLKDIFSSKITAALLLGMAISVFSFAVMLAINGTVIFVTAGIIIAPNINWLIIMLLISPAVSVISISLIVRRSAKAQSSEEAQSTSMFLVLPVILLIIGQFSGIMMLSTLLFFVLGVLASIIAVFTYKNLSAKFNYETLLR
jgi:ABC-type Na+ efflux pump permease subunit